MANDIAFTVAECGEFHSMGAYHKGIATMEEAKKLFDALQQEHNNLIPAIGINFHRDGTDEFQDIQCDILYGNCIDLDNLRFVPELWSDREAISKLSQIMEAFPNTEIYGSMPGMEVQDRQDPDMAIDMDAVKPVYVDAAARIAAEIDRFSRDFDPQEYGDTVDNWEVQVQNMAADIRRGEAGEYKGYLSSVLRESNNIEDVRKAAELLVKLTEYKPLAKVEELEEENLNQIDNYLSNTVPKAEERRIVRNEEHERIEEEERKRRARGERRSLRERLAEKKAIVTANSAVPQRETQRQAQNDRNTI